MIDFAKLVRTLVDHDVNFILIDGVAAVVHGSARSTQDLDILYSRDDANLDRIVAALQAYHPYLRDAPPGLPFRWDQDTVRHGLNFTLTTEIGAIDLLAEVAGGGTYDKLLPNCEEVLIEGHSVRVARSVDSPKTRRGTSKRPRGDR